MLSLKLDQLILFFCSLALFARIFLQPSLNNFEAMGPEHLATLINNLAIFVLAFLFILKRTILKENIRWPKIFCSLALFCLIATCSIFYSMDAPSSLLYIFDLWSSFFFMLILVNLLNTDSSVEIMAAVMILLMALVGLHAAYEYLLIPTPHLPQDADRGILQLIQSHRTPTIFGWPNILAGFVVMILPLTIIFLTAQRSVLIKLCTITAILIAVYALMITMTVSSWIGLGIALIVIFLILKRQSLSISIKIGGFFIISLIIIITACTLFNKMSNVGVNSMDARLQYLTSSFQLIKQHPFIGNGWRSYGIANVSFIKDINGRSNFAHNTYLQIWTELGIIGLLAFIGFLWELFKNAQALIQKNDHKNILLTCVLAAGILGCMVDNLFSYTMLKPQVALFWWALCALLIALKENNIATRLLQAQGTWKKIFLILTLLGVIVTTRLALAEYDYFTALHYFHRGTHYDKVEQLCVDAKQLNPWDHKYDLARAYALYGLYLSNHNIETLKEAQDAVLSTEGQVSLGFERDALLSRINASLTQ